MMAGTWAAHLFLRRGDGKDQPLPELNSFRNVLSSIVRIPGSLLRSKVIYSISTPIMRQKTASARMRTLYRRAFKAFPDIESGSAATK